MTFDRSPFRRCFRFGAVIGGLAVLPFLCLSAADSEPQQLMSVTRQAALSSNASQWNAFVRVQSVDGCSYVSLAQVAALIDGFLEWHSVQRQVSLHIRGR